MGTVLKTALGVTVAVLLLAMVAAEGRERSRCREAGGVYLGFGMVCLKPDAVIR